MKSLKIVVKNLKDAGVKEAEKAIVAIHSALEKACPEILVDTECSALEKGAAAILSPVLAGLKSQVEKLADLNGDGQVG